jgi:hypothetical protein
MSAAERGPSERYRFEAFGTIDRRKADRIVDGVDARDGVEWRLWGVVTAPDREEAFALVYEQVGEYGFDFQADGVDLSDPLPAP